VSQAFRDVLHEAGQDFGGIKVWGGVATWLQLQLAQKARHEAVFIMLPLCHVDGGMCAEQSCHTLPKGIIWDHHHLRSCKALGLYPSHKDIKHLNY